MQFFPLLSPEQLVTDVLSVVYFHWKKWLIKGEGVKKNQLAKDRVQSEFFA